MKIKGVILAGGTGSRLYPLTKTIQKHLLPVGGRCMLQHSVEKLTEAGINDILIVTGGEHLGAIAEFCGSGKEYGCHFTYKVQDEAGGIAQALSLADGFVHPGEHMCVILGDNIFEDSLAVAVKRYSLLQRLELPPAAMVMLKEVEDPERFGVATIDGNCVVRIDEKPDNPDSNLIVTGIYFYHSSVFEIIGNLEPSGRGELEITDVNNEYIRRKAMVSDIWKGWWTDAGTPESYRKANELVGW